MKFVVPLFVVALLSLESCREEIIKIEEPQVLLERIEEKNFVEEFKYNDKNQITQVKRTTTFVDGNVTVTEYNYAYDNKGQLTSCTTNFGVTYVYNYENNLIRNTQTFEEGKLTLTYEFTYDAQNRMISNVMSIHKDTGKEAEGKTTYRYDEDGNILEVKNYDFVNSEQQLVSTFNYSDYDNKKGMGALGHQVLNPFHKGSINNPGKIEMLNAQNTPFVTEAFNYTYNDLGYVQSMVTKTTFYHGDSGSHTTQFFFKVL